MQKRWYQSKKLWILLCAFIGVSCILAKDLVLTHVLQIYTSRALEGQGWNRTSIQRQGTYLIIEGLSKGRCHIGKAEIASHVSLIPFIIDPLIVLSDVSFTVEERLDDTSDVGGLALLLGDGIWQPKLWIDSGQIHTRFATCNFTFACEEKPHKMGSLFLQEIGKEEPFLQADFHRYGKEITTQIQITEAQASFVSPWLSPWIGTWQECRGQISAYIQGTWLLTGGCSSFQANISMRRLHLQDVEGQDIQAKVLESTLSFAKKEGIPLWRQMDLFITFEEAYLARKGHVGIASALGEIRLHPKEDPYIKVGGTLVAQDAYIPFEWEGSGELLEAGSYWLQTNLSLLLPHKTSQCAASFWQDEKGCGTLEVQCEGVGKEMSDIYQEIRESIQGPKIAVSQGEIAGKILYRFGGGCSKTWEFSGFHGKNVELVLEKPQVAARAQHVYMQGCIQEEKLSSLELKVQRGSYSYANTDVTDIAAQIEVVEGEFLPSYIEGTYGNIQMAVQVVGSGAENVIHLECALPVKNLMEWFAVQDLDIALQEPVCVVADLYPMQEKTKFGALMRLPIGQDKVQDIEWEGTLDKKISRKVQDLCSTWDFSSLEGGVQIQHLSSATMFALFPSYAKKWPVEGSCQLRGFFSQKELFAELFAVDIAIRQGPHKVMGQLGDKEPISFCYDRKTGLWKGKGGIDTLLYKDSTTGLQIEVVDTSFTWSSGKLIAEQCLAIVEDIPIGGTLLYEEGHVSFYTKASQMSFSSLYPVLTTYYPYLPSIPLQGLLSLQEKGGIFHAHQEGGQWRHEWSLNVQLTKGVYPLGAIGNVEDLEACISMDSQKMVSLQGIQGVYVGKDFRCHVGMQDVVYQIGEKIPIICKAQIENKELGAFFGYVHGQKEGWLIEVSPKSHVLGIGFQVDPFLVASSGVCGPIAGSCQYRLEHLPSYLSFFRSLGLSVPQCSRNFLSGMVQLRMLYEDAKIYFGAQSESISYQGNVLGSLDFRALWKEGLWVVDTCHVGPYELTCEARKKEDKWLVKNIWLEYPEGKVSAEGTYDPSLKKAFLSPALFSMQIQGIEIEGKGGVVVQVLEDAQLIAEGNIEKLVMRKEAISLSCRKGIHVQFSSQDGWTLQDMQGSLESLTLKKSLGQVAVESLRYCVADSKLYVEGVTLQWKKEYGQAFWPSMALSDGDLIAKGDGIFAKDYKKATVQIKQGQCNIAQVAIHPKQLQLLQEKERLYILCHGLCANIPMQLQWHSKCDFSDTTVTIKEAEHTSGLSLYMKRPWHLHTAEGSCLGLILKMKEVEGTDKKGTAYQVQLGVDFAKIAPLLPTSIRQSLQKWQIGDGYEFTGVATVEEKPFRWVSMQGRCTGKKCGMWGRTVQSVSTKIHATPTALYLQDFSLEDDVGAVSMKTLEAKEHKETGQWRVSIPFVHIKDFSPSLLLTGDKGGILLKNVSLYQLKGLMHDSFSFEGTGALNFVTVSDKKEISLWDIPLNLMKDLGLDTSILTPTTGEAEFMLSQGRCYFTAIKNMYSEGGRSKFDLASFSDDAYLSLDGTWHVDLKMKQNVVWKMTEDLVLSIRGSLAKPKYSFQRRKEGL